VRALNVYGDPAPWQPSPTWSASLLSFVNCEKYPPSLLYLAMTLGPGLIGLALFECARGTALTGADLVWLFRNPIMTKPAGFGVSLPSVYVLWLGIVFALYPLCRWFAALRQRARTGG
jgi:uncharacterized membrane protein